MILHYILLTLQKEDRIKISSFLKKKQKNSQMKRCPESSLSPETNGHHVSGVSATILIDSQAHLHTRNQSGDILLICVWRLSKGRQVT